MDKDLISKLARPTPRYTSYPTAPHFRDNIGSDQYQRWLGELPSAARLSLYFHIPYCDTLCWFCACSTKITRRYAPVATYLETMIDELEHVSGTLRSGGDVSHLHWGGGSPDILSSRDMVRLSRAVRSNFNVLPEAEFAVEIDPRAMAYEKIDALRESGVSRISLGVQDFEPVVQKAINRLQSFELTRSVVERFRQAGLKSVNIDLVYGLPYQTIDSACATIDAVIALQPDRIAVFGYAHLPQRVRHQRLIPDESVPGPVDRLALATLMAERLGTAGYLKIGIDHFCRPGDSMAHAPLRRNFQGYTTDTADALIGFGASAISRLPQGYAQNAAAIPDYRRRVSEIGVATVRGISLSSQDRARAFAIETLMCELRFPESELRRDFGAAGIDLANQGHCLEKHVGDGLLRSAANGFVVTEKGRPFLRALAAEFDAYLEGSQASHSVGI